MNKDIRDNNGFRISKKLLIIIMFFVMSIGYALLSQDFTINGSSKIVQQNWDIHWNNVQVSSGSVNIGTGDSGATITPGDTTEVTYEVSLSEPGDFYEFTVDAVNAGTVDARINIIDNKVFHMNGSNELEETTLPNYLTYSIKYNNDTNVGSNDLLMAGETKTYKVRVEYKKDITVNDLPSTATELIYRFEAEYVQAANTASMTTYTVNHKYKNLDNETYVVESQTINAIAGSSVSPDVVPRTGFVSPSIQTVTALGDGSTVVEYIYNREKCNLTLENATFISTLTPSGQYDYGTTISLTATERNNYTFVKWSNDEVNTTISFVITEDTTIGPIYESDYYAITYDVDGGSVSPASDDVYKGNSINSLPTPTKTGYYFDGWYLDSNHSNAVVLPYTPSSDVTLHAKFKKSVSSMIISNSSMSIDEGETETIDITNESEIEETYTFASDDTSVATVDAYGVVEGVSTGTATITITGTSSNQTKTVSVEVTSNLPTHYRVYLDVNGGDPLNVSYIDVPVGDNIGTLPEPTYTNKIFEGWYTGIGTGTQVTSSFTPNAEITIHARWKDYICKRATTLHTEQCSRTSQGCFAMGYTANGTQGTTTITYGSLSVGNFAVGNVYDCDVNGDGTYNSTNERFYYLGARGDNAVLIFYNNFEGQNGVAHTNIFSYTDAPNQLPTTSQWSNLNVSFNGKAARYAYATEIADACGITNLGTSNTAVGTLDSCIYLLENSRFSSTSTGRTAYWLEENNSTYYRVFTTDRHIGVVDGNESNNAVRPVIEVGVNYVDNSIDPSSMATITFITDSPNSLAPVSRVKNVAIGILPEVSKPNNTFAGWYSDSEFNNLVTASTVVTGDMTLYAKWDAIQGVASIGDTGYNSLSAAISAVTNSNPTTIRLIQSTDETVSIPTGRNIVLDLQNNTLSSSTGTVVTNSGTLIIENGTISCGASSGAVNNNATGVLTINDATIEATDGKQALYNNGGTATITGDSVLTSAATVRATLHNLASGTVNILDGTIISTGAYAVYNDSGTLNIGEEDGVSDSTAPIIQGKTYGAVGVDPYNFYDGTIKGITAPVGKASSGGTTPTVTVDTGETKIANIEDDSEYSRSTEVIGNDTYNTLSLSMLVNKYKIKFDANGGTASFASKTIDAGDQIGELPTATRGVYTFDGWYTGVDSGVQVSSTDYPSASVTYYAHWSYQVSSQVVNYNITNDVMGVYYNNIATWKNDESTFQSVMQTNFDNYNCKCTDNTCSTAGTVLCDKPKSYDTGVGEALNVYLYDETNQTVGAQVNYTASSDGVIHNMIPGQAYYWEVASLNSVHGYVKAVGNRRWLDIDGVRNARDLGGLPVDSNNDGVVDGTTKYGRLFRGEKLGTAQASVTQLTNLGVNEEIELRGTSEIASNEAKFSNYKHMEMKHYQIDVANYPTYYTWARNAVTAAMQDIVSGNNIYFHCRIGADRTGTLAYILEGLLQVQDEARLQDYEMSFFFGLINRHRYFSNDPTSSVSKTEKFVYMHNFLTTSQDIIDWYMDGSSDVSADTTLINNFRTAMISSS